MTYTIDQVKRLVPEATWNEDIEFWIISGALIDNHIINLLATTRRQLEIARDALETVSEGAGPPDCIAQRALDAIKKEGE